MENLLRSTKERMRIFLIGNSLSTASDILTMFNFIPEDFDELRERAMPKRTSTLSVAQKNRIKALSASNYTLAEIANKLGVSTSTVSKYLKE